MDPLVTSTLISTGSSLLGGVFGGKGKRGPDLDDMYAQQARIDRNRPSWVVEGAKAAGIHPLVAMGMQPVGAASASFGDGGSSRNAADIASEMGQGVSRAVQAWGSREEREMAKASARLSLENQQLQNERLRSEIRLANAPGTGPGIAANPVMPGQGAVRNVPQEFYDSLPTILGTGSNKPMHVNAIDEDGDPIRVYNTNDLGDNEWAQAMHLMRYSIPDYAHHKITRPLSKKLSNFIRRLMNSSGSPRKYKYGRGSQ